MKKIILALICFLVLSSQCNPAAWYFWRYRLADDCTTLVDGREQDLCYEVSSGKLYKCQPDDTICDTPEEWKLVSGGGGAEKLEDLDDVNNVTYVAGQYLRANGSQYVSSSIQDGDLPASVTRDSEWDTIAEIEAATGVNIITASENNDSADDLSNNTTDDLAEGSSNLYWTQTRFDNAFSSKTTDDLSEGSTNKYCTLSNIQSACSNDFHNIGGTDDDQPDDDSEVPNVLSITRMPNLTTNGFIKTINSDGTLSVDTNTYLTAESDPIWSSDKSDYYTKVDLQTSGQASVHWNNLTNKPANLDTDSTDDLTTSTTFGGDISGTYSNISVNKIKGKEVDDSGIGDGKVLKYNASTGKIEYATDQTGSGGSPVALDLDDDGTNESDDLTEIATINDTNNIFTEPSADKFLIDCSKNWPAADAVPWSGITGMPAGFADGVDDVDDADHDSTNELQNLFSSFTDGTNTATADEQTDVFKFRSADNLLTITVTNDDSTHGDNVLFDVNNNLSAYNNDAGFLTNESDPVWSSDKSDYYTKTDLQTSGSSQVHWDNLTNKPTNLDTDSTDDLTTTTNFSGDVSGTYNNMDIAAGAVTTTEIADGTITHTDVSASDSLRIGSIELIIGDGQNVISTGFVADFIIDAPMTILAYTITCKETGSIQIDIWKDTFANRPPTDEDSITGSNPVSISNDNGAQDTTLAGWTTSLNQNDMLRFNVDSATTVTKCTLSLRVRKD